MTEQPRQPLPLGTSDFATLRNSNEIYVDKTEMVYQLACVRGKVFLSRPRRFGKSLLVSTFESLFKYGLRDFKGLAIEKLWDDKTYCVARLDFSEVKDFSDKDDFAYCFDDLLKRTLEPVGFQYKKEKGLLIGQISSWMASLPRASLVLLIDEYDAPLTACIDKGDLFKSIRSVMSRFFQAVKSNEGCLRFFFMTGVTKYRHTSIFSELNNMTDITLDSEYGELLGYTKEEIIENFSLYLDRARDTLNLARTDLLENLKTNYDGFCFDEFAQTHVYCPWSVLNFLNQPKRGFQNYWYVSGGHPTVLMKFLINHALEEPMAYSEVKQVRLTDLDLPQKYDEMSMETLLTQTGYLTIRHVKDNGFAVLGYPNREVSVSMAQLFANELLKGKAIEAPQAPTVKDTMKTGTVDQVVEYFNLAVNAIDYARYPITSEAACRAYLQVLLIGAALVPDVEKHSSLGRSDLEVNVGNRRWVLEFKFAEQSLSVNTLLNQAVKQIQERHYGETPHGKELFRVALVFDAPERRFTAWQVV